MVAVESNWCIVAKYRNEGRRYNKTEIRPIQIRAAGSTTNIRVKIASVHLRHNVLLKRLIFAQTLVSNCDAEKVNILNKKV